jgi:acyl carrier protein phosphodiesterase
MHGSVGRHTRARAEHLATVGQGLEKRLLVARKTVAGQVYDGRAEEQLVRKKEEVDARSAGLRRRLRDREQWLERLEGVAGLREAVEEMSRIKGEISRVREEVGRLESAR